MKTVIGIDYGTQSARALLLSAEDGRVLASYSSPYPHGILPGDLCSAEDYEDLFYILLRKVTPEEYRSTVAGICVDATSMTLVPVAADGEILGRKPEFANEPRAPKAVEVPFRPGSGRGSRGPGPENECGLHPPDRRAHQQRMDAAEIAEDSGRSPGNLRKNRPGL